MPKINIDELCKPIEVTVGGKDYTLEDIPQETVKKMVKLGNVANKIQENIKETTELMEKAKTAGDSVGIKQCKERTAKLMKKAEDDSGTDELVAIMTSILGAEKADIGALGMRKLTMLVKRIMDTINEELEGKNVPEVAVVK